MEGYGGPAQAVANHRAMHQRRPGLEALDAIRRPRDTPIWKLEAALKCRFCKKGHYAPAVHMIKLTATQEVVVREERGFHACAG
jgi:hypothetical protein